MKQCCGLSQQAIVKKTVVTRDGTKPTLVYVGSDFSPSSRWRTLADNFCYDTNVNFMNSSQHCHWERKLGPSLRAWNKWQLTVAAVDNDSKLTLQKSMNMALLLEDALQNSFGNGEPLWKHFINFEPYTEVLQKFKTCTRRFLLEKEWVFSDTTKRYLAFAQDHLRRITALVSQFRLGSSWHSSLPESERTYDEAPILVTRERQGRGKDVVL
jgi:hypothetical protein